MKSLEYSRRAGSELRHCCIVGNVAFALFLSLPAKACVTKELLSLWFFEFCPIVLGVCMMVLLFFFFFGIHPPRVRRGICPQKQQNKHIHQGKASHDCCMPLQSVDTAACSFSRRSGGLLPLKAHPLEVRGSRCARHVHTHCHPYPTVTLQRLH